MISKKSILICIWIILISSLFANDNRETRAVWVTTNYKLDWPPNTSDETNQKESLRKIFEDIKSRNFNTIYFQVRSNGTVLYNSEIEPFSPYLTGVVGKAPSYDPLQYAIDLGKELNLEVHAWVNMMRCFSGSDDSFLKHPKHIRNSFPDYTVRVMGEHGSLSYWMNPGYFRAQDYLVNILVELTTKYDVDGIHLDFFRYPDKKFEDDKYFENYNLGISLGDWRRNNLTTILRKFKEKAKPLNPYLKIGATPIGIRKSLDGAIGWEGYSSVFQDTETWLKEELVDYLAPQIYWNINDNPKFDILAKDWVNKSYNKNIVLGLAAYKNDVIPELQEMIDLSREFGAAGISFFRYENISSLNKNYFKKLAFPSNMEWKVDENEYSKENIYCNYLTLTDDQIIINWKDDFSDITKNQRSYVLLQKSKPIKYLSLNKNKVKLKFGNPSKLAYSYQIGKIDRLWNYSSISNDLEIRVPYLESLKKSSYVNTKPLLLMQGKNKAILSITSFNEQSALLDTFSKENLREQKLLNLKVGINLVPIEQNFEMLKSLRITFADNRQEELNFL